MTRHTTLPLPVLVRQAFKNRGVRFRQRISPGGSYYYEFTLAGKTRLVRVSDHVNTTRSGYTWEPDYNITVRKDIKPLAKDLKRGVQQEAWDRLVGEESQ